MNSHIRFVGSGDAFGSGGRFQTCILGDIGGRRFLLDCGASSLIALKAQAIDPNSVEAILLTHLHGCLLYTSDAADEEDSVDLGGRRIIKKKKKQKKPNIA